MMTDLIIIGAGPGGYEMAAEAAQHGLSVVVVEKGYLGGTCLNRGCIPTKALCRNAEVVELIRNSAEFGVDAQIASLNFAKMMERKDAVVAQLREGIAALMGQPNITLVTGEAALKDAHTVTVDGTDYEADNIVIATGSAPSCLPIDGAALPGVLTSDEMLSLTELPKSLCIIGGGVIGMEFAGIFNSLGVEVAVVEFCKEILPNFDKDVAKRMKQSLSKKGVNVLTSAAVKSIAQGEGGLVVAYEQKGKEKTVECEKVLMSVGRRPVLPEGVEALGIEMNRRAIVVNDDMLTNVPSVYAIGDVNARCMLAHAASYQGKRALNHIIAKREGKPCADGIRFDIIPGAVFTVPEVSMVGLTEEQCEAQGIEVVTKKSFFRANGKALSMAETDGMVKMIARADNGQIVGCHICGAHAADLIQEVVTAMNCGKTARELAEMVHGHPTLSEVVLAAANQF